MRRGAIYEKVYLECVPDEFPESARLLREALCITYKETLQLMARTKCALDESAGRRFLQALLYPGEGAQLLQGLNDAEARMGREVQACEAEQRKVENKLFRELLQSLEDPLRHNRVRLDAMLKTFDADERSRMLDLFSQIQVGDQHYRRTKMRTEGSGKWLLKHPKFQSWENSSSSSILWLTGQGRPLNDTLIRFQTDSR